MKVRKAVGIPVEIWKSMSEEGVEWLTGLLMLSLRPQ